MAMYEGSADAKRMAGFYSKFLIPTAEEHFGKGKQAWWLLHDNDSRHGAPAVRTVLHNAGVNVLDFPPYSPDLNPIENLWTDISKRMEGKPASSKKELEATLQEAWGETQRACCEKLARSMPERIAQCIARKGAYTDF
jgi:hypothetical protein